MKLIEALRILDGLSLRAVDHMPHPAELIILSEKEFYKIDIERGCFCLTPSGRAALAQGGE